MFGNCLKLTIGFVVVLNGGCVASSTMVQHSPTGSPLPTQFEQKIPDFMEFVRYVGEHPTSLWQHPDVRRKFIETGKALEQRQRPERTELGDIAASPRLSVQKHAFASPVTSSSSPLSEIKEEENPLKEKTDELICALHLLHPQSETAIDALKGNELAQAAQKEAAESIPLILGEIDGLFSSDPSGCVAKLKGTYELKYAINYIVVLNKTEYLTPTLQQVISAAYPAGDFRTKLETIRQEVEKEGGF